MKTNRNNRFFRITTTRFFLTLIVIASLSSCEREFLPKPLGYNRLELPQPSYRPLPDSLPYHFEYSAHASLLRDTSYVRGRYWIEIYYPGIKSNIHITYQPLR